MTLHQTSRREFLRQAACSAVGYSALLSTVFDLHKVEAAAEVAGDYRALVCVFLYGGNDGNNMVVPRDADTYQQYAAARGSLAVPLDAVLPLSAPDRDGRAYGLHPSMAGLQGLFEGGRLAILGNVGPLVEPITRAEYQNRSRGVPRSLFSHSDQQVLWQTSIADGHAGTGWGGRTADLLRSLNDNAQVSMSISLGGTNTFQVGRDVFQYQVGTTGPVALARYAAPPSTDPESRALDRLLALEHANIFEHAYRGIVRRAIDNEQMLRGALAAAPALATAFPASRLGGQLRMAAQLIGIRDAIGQRRQIFFCATGGYDTHALQANDHPTLLRELSEALTAFQAALTELGVDGSVTTFTASDFGRTLASNGSGSDHGWGNHHLILGGAVRGQAFYGRFPVLAVNGPDDVGQGRWIPTTSVDEYSATLARWFGVAPGRLADVLPNIGRFATPDLGFLQV
jgi:uncharacterized protein (DUF1501 family)